MDENIMGVNVNPDELSRYARAATAREDEESGTILVSDLKKVLLGRQGENDTQTVVIDASAWLTELPGCQLTVAALRPGEREVYLPSVTVSNGVITWPILLQDTALAGTGKAEVRAIKNGKVKKSVVFWTRIEPSLEGDGTPNPPTPPDWAVEILDAVEEAEEAAASAAASAEATAEAAVNSVRYDAAQSLTDQQKDRARTNIGAASAAALPGKVDVAQGAGNAGKALIVGSDGNVTLGTSGVPESVRTALMNIFRHVAYVDGDGNDYLDALYAALYNDIEPPEEKWRYSQADGDLVIINYAISYDSNLKKCRLSGTSSQIRRSPVLAAGDVPYVLPNTGEPSGYFAIPVPKTATKFTVTATPSTLQGTFGVYKIINAAGEQEQHTPGLGWQALPQTVAFEPSENLIIRYGFRVDSSDTSFTTNTEPKNVVIQFE